MPVKDPVHPWETSEALWIRIHLDFAVPFLDKIFLILYDSYSRWIEVCPMSNITSKATINRWEKNCGNSNGDFIISINRFLLYYRRTLHSFTSLSPAELLVNQKIKTRLSLLKPHINKINDEESLISLKTNSLPRWPRLG